MQHLARKRQLGWSDLGAGVGGRNCPVHRKDNKETGIPLQINVGGDDSEFGPVTGRQQLPVSLGAGSTGEQGLQIPRAGRTGAQWVQSTSRDSSEPTAWRITMPLAYYLHQRSTTKG